MVLFLGVVEQVSVYSDGVGVLDRGGGMSSRGTTGAGGTISVTGGEEVGGGGGD